MARAVLFDLDDTLFDHRRSARAALAALHRVHGRGTDLDAFERHHTQVPRSDAPRSARRPHRGSTMRGASGSGGYSSRSASRSTTRTSTRSRPRTAPATCRRAARSTAPPICCIAVRPHARIGIVTNNLLEEQQDKLAYCGLAASGGRADRLGRRRRLEAGSRDLRHRARADRRDAHRRGHGRRLLGQRHRRRGRAPGSARSGSIRIASRHPARRPASPRFTRLRRRRRSCR